MARVTSRGTRTPPMDDGLTPPHSQAGHSKSSSRSRSRTRAKVDVLQELGPDWKEAVPVALSPSLPAVGEHSDDSTESEGATPAMESFIQSSEVFYGPLHGSGALSARSSDRRSSSRSGSRFRKQSVSPQPMDAQPPKRSISASARAAATQPALSPNSLVPEARVGHAFLHDDTDELRSQPSKLFSDSVMHSQPDMDNTGEMPTPTPSMAQLPVAILTDFVIDNYYTAARFKSRGSPHNDDSPTSPSSSTTRPWSFIARIVNQIDIGPALLHNKLEVCYEAMIINVMRCRNFDTCGVCLVVDVAAVRHHCICDALPHREVERHRAC